MSEPTNPAGTVWGYSIDEDEGFQGAFTTKEEAIEKGNARFKNEPETGGTFWIQPGAYPPVTKVAPDYGMLSEHVVDLIGDNAHEAWDDMAEDFPDVSPEAKKELENELKSVIDAWMMRHLEAPCWEPEGDPEPVRIT
jgi:hypothetical protein